MASLNLYLKKVAKGDVKKLCQHTRELLYELDAAGEVTNDLLANLIEALKEAPDSNFQRWLSNQVDLWSMRKLDWKQDGSDLMEEAETYYQEAISTNRWGRKAHKQEIQYAFKSVESGEETEDEKEKKEKSKTGNYDDMNPRNLVGKQVLVGKTRTPGVIGAKPVQLMNEEERRKKVPLDALRIDLGPEGKAKAGDRAGFATRFRRVGPSILSKAIDDRIGVATLIEILRQTPSHVELCAAFTVQEEIGLRGAKVATQYFNPDLAIAIDSTPARDLPVHDGSENMVYNTKLGLGPAIYISDGAMLHDPRLVRFLQATAEAERIPYQFRQPGGGGTDARAIQRALAGIPTVSISVPHRYTHSPDNISRLEDWKNTLNLLHAALQRVTPGLIADR